MTSLIGRREFLGAAAAATLLPSRPASAGPRADVKVVVWDERQPAQKQAYDNFLGNQIADHLRSQGGLSVRSVALDDPGQGLGDDVLGDAQVLVWWGHVRHPDVTPATSRKVVSRILEGKLSLIALHSAHWSTPFVEAMNERARRDLNDSLAGASKVVIREVTPERRYVVPRRDARPTPYSDVRKFPDGHVEATLHLPICCFPAYRGDGKPSTVRVPASDHPVMQGVPATFQIPQTEMYDEPFHVPEPDTVLFEESWAPGEWFRGGMLWKLGKGHVMYFRPGHETFPVFKQEPVLKILTNAVRWLGRAEA